MNSIHNIYGEEGNSEDSIFEDDYDYEDPDYEDYADPYAGEPLMLLLDDPDEIGYAAAAARYDMLYGFDGHEDEEYEDEEYDEEDDLDYALGHDGPYISEDSLTYYEGDYSEFGFDRTKLEQDPMALGYKRSRQKQAEMRRVNSLHSDEVISPRRIYKVLKPDVPVPKILRINSLGGYDSLACSMRRAVERNSPDAAGYGGTLNSFLYYRQLSSNDLPPQLIAPALLPSKELQRFPYLDRVYSGQYSFDGRLFFACTQDFKIHLYDTTVSDQYKRLKTLTVPSGRQWTITDADMSRDNRFIVSSSISSAVAISQIESSNEEQRMIDIGEGRHELGIWSVRLSPDGRDIIAGANDGTIYICDLNACRIKEKLGVRHTGHLRDCNTACLGDDSGNIIFSGSDDGTVRVWDRRKAGTNHEEVGGFVGHTEGITFVDSKGDGIHLISNSKDQSLKLWDIRMMLNSRKLDEISKHFNRISTGYDYRFERYMGPRLSIHPYDTSLVTYYGHRVTDTLIRCHFSPASTTGQNYIYSGSSDGKVYIWKINGELANTVGTGDRDFFQSSFFDNGHRYGVNRCVRDVSWHPNASMLAASSWANSHSRYHYNELAGLVQIFGLTNAGLPFEEERDPRDDESYRDSHQEDDESESPEEYDDDYDPEEDEIVVW